MGGSLWIPCRAVSVTLKTFMNLRDQCYELWMETGSTWANAAVFADETLPRRFPHGVNVQSVQSCEPWRPALENSSRQLMTARNLFFLCSVETFLKVHCGTSHQVIHFIRDVFSRRQNHGTKWGFRAARFKEKKRKEKQLQFLWQRLRFTFTSNNNNG